MPTITRAGDRGCLLPGLAELAFDNGIGDAAQMAAEALAIEIELLEHVFTPGHRNTVQPIEPFIVDDMGFERGGVFKFLNRAVKDLVGVYLGCCGKIEHPSKLGRRRPGRFHLLDLLILLAFHDGVVG